MHPSWTIEEFGELNPPNQANGRSRLDVLKGIGAFLELCVFEAANVSVLERW